MHVCSTRSYFMAVSAKADKIMEKEGFSLAKNNLASKKHQYDGELMDIFGRGSKCLYDGTSVASQVVIFFSVFSSGFTFIVYRSSFMVSSVTNHTPTRSSYDKYLHFAEMPFGQVPVLEVDGKVLYVAEQRDRQVRRDR